MLRNSISPILTGTVVLAIGTGGWAQPFPAGGEFQVSGLDYLEYRPAVAAGPAGGFVVVWESDGSPGTDTDGFSVQVRSFDAEGVAINDAFQVNVYPFGNQDRPAVAVAEDGRFLVLWESRGMAGIPSISGRRFDASGTVVGDEMQINEYPHSGSRPAVVALAGGGYLVAWENSGIDDISGRRLDAEGVALGEEFSIHGDSVGSQRRPAIARMPGGGLVAVWENDTSRGFLPSTSSIRGQRFGVDGSRIGGEFDVNPPFDAPDRDPAIAVAEDGGMLFVWSSPASPGDDTSGLSVLGQRVDPDGVLEGTFFQVNTATSFDQHDPAVLAGPEGEFVVTWASDDGTGIQGQVVAADGSLRGGQFPVSETSGGGSSTLAPAMARLTASRYLVAWSLEVGGGSRGRRFSFACTDDDTLCLRDARFLAEIEWRDFEDVAGVGHPLPFRTDESGLFWFFDPENWEVMVKVLDGCGFNGAYWVFSAATTNVEYTLRVTDTRDGTVRSYTNPLGIAAPAITDVGAFPSCP